MFTQLRRVGQVLNRYTPPRPTQARRYDPMMGDVGVTGVRRGPHIQ